MSLREFDDAYTTRVVYKSVCKSRVGGLK
jgi:hypothetical protein